MFSYVRGTIIDQEGSRLTLLVQNTGLGLEIFVPLYAVPQILQQGSEEVSLYLHHHFTDAGQSLFGFLTPQDRIIFRQLLKISGIGGKGAINILGLGIHRLLEAIEKNDDKLISSVPGIGKKIAMKIILEFKNSRFSLDDFMEDAKPMTLARPYDQDILEALTKMGYDKKKTESIIEKIPEDIETLQEKIVYCLKQLGNGK